MVSFKLMASATNGIITRASKAARKSLNITDDIIKAGEKQRTSSFRDSELFKEFKEVDEFIPTYGLDDLPLASSLNPRAQQYSTFITKDVLDTDHLVKANILGTNQVVYLDTVYAHSWSNNTKLLDYYEAGHKFQDSANIYAKARSKEYINDTYIKDAHKLISEGHPLELVLKYMDEALIRGSKRYEAGLLDFIANNPGKKSLVVVKNQYGLEMFDKVGANNFHILENLCKNDNEINTILKTCRCKEYNGGMNSNENLCDFAIEILQKQKEWTADSTELLRALKTVYERNHIEVELVNHQALQKARAFIQEGLTPQETIKKLKDLKLIPKR